MPVKCRHCFYNFLFCFCLRELHFCARSILNTLIESGRSNQTHTHTHRLGNGTRREGRIQANISTGLSGLSVSMAVCFHGSQIWSLLLPLEWPKDKLLVLKINQAALYLESQPTHSPKKIYIHIYKNQQFPSLIKDSISTWGRRREEEKIPQMTNRSFLLCSQQYSKVSKTHWQAQGWMCFMKYFTQRSAKSCKAFCTTRGTKGGYLEASAVGLPCVCSKQSPLIMLLPPQLLAHPPHCETYRKGKEIFTGGLLSQH